MRRSKWWSLWGAVLIAMGIAQAVIWHASVLGVTFGALNALAGITIFTRLPRTTWLIPLFGALGLAWLCRGSTLDRGFGVFLLFGVFVALAFTLRDQLVARGRRKCASK